jgi:hypothetical protein
MIQGKIGNLELKVVDIKQTHIKELFYFKLYLGDKLIGYCNYFSGRDYYPDWLEIDYYPWLRDVGLEEEFFKKIYNFLSKRGRLFVTYDKDKETLDMIMKGYSAVDTPLGFSLLKAGFTWFKVWYFPEGGNEGSPKIQANKPLDENIAIKELEELLEDVKSEKVKDWINAKRKSRNFII